MPQVSSPVSFCQDTKIRHSFTPKFTKLNWRQRRDGFKPVTDNFKVFPQKNIAILDSSMNWISMNGTLDLDPWTVQVQVQVHPVPLPLLHLIYKDQQPSRKRGS
jgi:hypothetical protein